MIKTGIKIIHCKNQHDASEKALELLLDYIDEKTLLFLSGGSSPKQLYQLIAQHKKLKPGAVALIDERYGLPMHSQSNEKMIMETGMVNYLENEKIPFYGILKEGRMDDATGQYEVAVKDLFKSFPKKIAIMGIGTDGHTAGIKPDLVYDHNRLVVSYDDENGYFGKRITLTFEALSEIEEFIILVFGEEKRKVLAEILRSADQTRIPAVFYTKFPGKVTVLTDLT